VSRDDEGGCLARCGEADDAVELPLGALRTSSDARIVAQHRTSSTPAPSRAAAARRRAPPQLVARTPCMKPIALLLSTFATAASLHVLRESSSSPSSSKMAPSFLVTYCKN
jgi:hypothetical protein